MLNTLSAVQRATAQSVGTGLPSRTEIEGWAAAIAALEMHSDSYRAAAHQIECSADTYAQQLSSPGGSEWLGSAADAAMARAYSDRGVIYDAADSFRDAARVAAAGSQDLRLTRERALEAIADAEAEGFLVSDDLTVSDSRPVSSTSPTERARRIAEAVAHQGLIEMTAAALASQDYELAARLDIQAAQVMAMIPPEWADPIPADYPTARPLDALRHPERPPANDLLSVRNAEDVHRIVDPLPPGRQPGVKTLPTPEAILGLYGQLTENSMPGPPSTYPGQWRVLEDGTRVGMRPTSKFGGPTVEIWYPDGTKTDVHLAERPKVPTPAPAPAPQPAPVPIPEPSPPEIPAVLPRPDLGTQPALSPEDAGVLGVLGALGIGIVVGIGELGKLIFSP